MNTSKPVQLVGGIGPAGEHPIENRIYREPVPIPSISLNKDENNKQSLAGRFPVYKSHKVVLAAHIMALGTPHPDDNAVVATVVTHPGWPSLDVVLTADFVARYAPQSGSYIVIYEDGYASVSPQEAFETGYAPVPTSAQSAPPAIEVGDVVQLASLEGPLLVVSGLVRDAADVEKGEVKQIKLIFFNGPELVDVTVSPNVVAVIGKACDLLKQRDGTGLDRPYPGTAAMAANSPELDPDGNTFPRPTVGESLVYIISALDAEKINRRRTDGGSISARLKEEKWPEGAQAHIGNTATEGDAVPFIAIRAWGGAENSVNGQALLDGNDQLWVTSAPAGPLGELVTGHWYPAYAYWNLKHEADKKTVATPTDSAKLVVG